MTNGKKRNSRSQNIRSNSGKSSSLYDLQLKLWLDIRQSQKHYNDMRQTKCLHKCVCARVYAVAISCISFSPPLGWLFRILCSVYDIALACMWIFYSIPASKLEYSQASQMGAFQTILWNMQVKLSLHLCLLSHTHTHLQECQRNICQMFRLS